jgi:hypothetical protein
MPATVKLSGNLTKRQATSFVGKAIRSVYVPMGDDLLGTLQRDLPGHFAKSPRKRISGQGFNTKLLLYSNAKGIEYIEEGRKPGKAPPPDVLLKWVRRKGLGGNALSIKTRRALVVGIRRTFSRKEGKLRTRAQSLLAKQKSIAFLIGRAIAKEGLPRNTGRKPSHRLFLFRDIVKHNPGLISGYNRLLQSRVNQILNANS